MTLTCPCCRASNESAVICRRCKADLSLMADLEAERDYQLSMARLNLNAGDPLRAHYCTQKAIQLRHDVETKQLESVGALLAGNFDQAFELYRIAVGVPCN